MICYNGNCPKSSIMDPPPGRIWKGRDFPKIGEYIWKPEWFQWEIPGVARMTDAGVARDVRRMALYAGGCGVSRLGKAAPW